MIQPRTIHDYKRMMKEKKEELKWDFRGAILPILRQYMGNFAITIGGETILTQHRYVQISGKTIQEILGMIRADEYISFTFSRSNVLTYNDTFEI